MRCSESLAGLGLDKGPCGLHLDCMKLKSQLMCTSTSHTLATLPIVQHASEGQLLLFMSGICRLAASESCMWLVLCRYLVPESWHQRLDEDGRRVPVPHWL